MRTLARPLLLACALAAAAAVRVVAFAMLDRRPLLGGWEAPDLQRSMFYHYGLHGHLDWTFAEQVARDSFKPPLWYGGVPLLFGWKPSLAASDYLLVNAGCAAVVVLGGFFLGRRLGGASTGALAAASCALLPGIAWRVGMVGVEPAHAALLVLAMLALVGLTQSARVGETRDVALRGVVLGLCVGAGALMKWNFVAYVAPAAGVAWALAGRGWRQAALGLGVAAAAAAALFAPWALGADLADVLSQGADGEPTADGVGFYARELVGRSSGWLGAGVAVAAALALALRSKLPTPPAVLRAPHPGTEAVVIGAACASLWAVHALIPHKETRYLLPALPLLCVLLAWPASTLLRARSPLGPVALAAAVVLGALHSWVLPWFAPVPASHAWSDVLPAPIDDDYDLLAIVAHPSLRERARTVVTTSLAAEDRFPVLTFLNWELYGRNANPVLSRSDWPDVTSKACAFDLERSTHFMSNRQLDMHEESALRSMGFERIVTVRPRIDELGALQLWALDPASEPRYR